MRTKAGAIGCFLSHVEALKAAAAFDGVTHIIEDDVMLSGVVRHVLASDVPSRILDQFDIVFLSLWIDYVNLPALVSKYRSLPREVQFLDIGAARISSTDSYIVSGKTAAKLLRLLDIAGPKKPIDNMLQHLVRLGEIKAGFALPFLSCIDSVTGAGSSIVEVPPDEYALLTQARRLVYVEGGMALPERHGIAERLWPAHGYISALAS